MKESNPTSKLSDVRSPLEETSADDYEDVDNNYSDGETWNEMSWRKYKDNLLDYGEESEWDKFLEEEELFYS